MAKPPPNEIEFDSCRAWLDDPNFPYRMVVQRAPNRHQAYQRDGEKFYSVGYFLQLSDIRKYLAGGSAELMAEFGEDTDRERLEFTVLALDQYL